LTTGRLPIDIPAEISGIATDVPADLFNAPFRSACERLDRYIGAVVAQLALELELPVGSPITPEALVAGRGWAANGELSLRWLLETLQTYGMATASDGGWCLRPITDPTPRAAELSTAAVLAMPQTAPTYRVFDLCTFALGAVLRGEARGEEALFSAATLGLWFEYFSNDNPHYALNNTLAAAVLSRAAAPGAHLLEVGGGGGSAALATLAALVDAGKPPASYTFTELHPAFLRRGARAVQAAAPPRCAVATMRYDIDGDPAVQDLAGRTFDAILAVNTLHLARDLVTTLARLRSLLRPGGTLVLGELLRPHATAGVHIELPFTLLEAYRSAPLLAGIRPRPGFLAPEGWHRALRAAGFPTVALIPAEFARCVELYPGFYCGALIARV
jgi:SAM-dependent methyltransferase